MQVCWILLTRKADLRVHKIEQSGNFILGFAIAGVKCRAKFAYLFERKKICSISESTYVYIFFISFIKTDNVSAFMMEPCASPKNFKL